MTDSENSILVKEMEFLRKNLQQLSDQADKSHRQRDTAVAELEVYRKQYASYQEKYAKVSRDLSTSKRLLRTLIRGEQREDWAQSVASFLKEGPPDRKGPSKASAFFDDPISFIQVAVPLNVVHQSNEINYRTLGCDCYVCRQNEV